MAEDTAQEAVEAVEVPTSDSNEHLRLAEAKRVEAMAETGENSGDLKAAGKRRAEAHKAAVEAANEPRDESHDNETSADREARSKTPEGRTSTPPTKQTTSAANPGKARA